MAVKTGGLRHIDIPEPQTVAVTRQEFKFNIGFDGALQREGWRVGTTPRDCIEEIFKGEPQGTFVVRESTNEARKGKLVISTALSGERVSHHIVERASGGFFLKCEGEGVKIFETLREMIIGLKNTSEESRKQLGYPTLSIPLCGPPRPKERQIWKRKISRK